MAGFHLDDTIAAVSTAMAPAGIGIVKKSAETMHSKWRTAYSVQKRRKKAFRGQIPYDSLWMDYRKGRKVIDEVLVMVNERTENIYR